MDQEALVRYFADLGFGPADTPVPKEVKDRWKSLCQKHHPDKGGSKEEFLRVTHAYNMLTDLEYRHRHMITEGRRQKPNSVGDLNVRIQLPLQFVDAFFGRDVVISYNRLVLNEADLTPVTDLAELDIVSHRLRVPQGSTNGFETVAGGLGHKCGSTYGDAHIVVTPLPHSKFRVQDGNVLSVERFPLETFLKGGTVDVTTMYGLKPLRIPPGTIPGTLLKIKNCGVASQNSHLVQADVVFPTKDDLKTGAWAGLGIDWEAAEAKDKEEQDLQELFRQHSGTSGNIIFTFK